VCDDQVSPSTIQALDAINTTYRGGTSQQKHATVFHTIFRLVWHKLLFQMVYQRWRRVQTFHERSHDGLSPSTTPTTAKNHHDQCMRFIQFNIRTIASGDAYNTTKSPTFGAFKVTARTPADIENSLSTLNFRVDDCTLRTTPDLKQFFFSYDE
jgi:hypothetical protein